MKTSLILTVCLSFMGAAGSFAVEKKEHHGFFKRHVEEKELTPAQRFEKMDVNHDDLLSHAEFLPHHKDIVVAKKEFAAMDTDKDGKVSREEFLAHHHKK